MKATKIDWCDATINPVVGRKNNCPWCYANRLNDRFGWVSNFNDPQFFPERMKQFNSKTPKTIFCDSMSDIAYWDDAAVKLKVLEIKKKFIRYLQKPFTNGKYPK